MAKIIEFPKTTLKYQIEQEMEKMRGSLKEMYSALDKVDKGYRVIEKQAQETEDSYQDLMMMYIDEVGEDNVPLEWLEFCPYVGMERGPDGKIKITLIRPPEEKK